jgi:CRP-like cAMP-binding protein
MDMLAPGTPEQLMACGHQRAIGAGEVLVAQGVEASHLFILLSGVVKVTAVSESGEASLIAVRAAGDLIGELSMVSDGRRSATVIAARLVHTLQIFETDFRTVLRSRPDAADAFTRALASKLRATVDTRSNQRAPARERLARLFLTLTQQHGRPSGATVVIDLPLSQPDLGGLIGASEPTVQKAVSELKRTGILEVRGHRCYAVRDLTGLRRIADGEHM